MPPRIASARPGAAAGGGFTRGSSGPFKPPRPQTVHEVADDTDDAGSPTDAATDNDDDTDDFPTVKPTGRTNQNKNGRNTANQKSRTSSAAAAAAARPVDDDNDNDDDDDDDTAPKSLPPALLARLMHHFFQNSGPAPTRLTQDAHVAVGKYMEIFVREAVARSVAERRGDGGGFLDVDVLQKVAGQLIMDM